MTPLEKIIRDRIARDGPMDVAAFMELAVTHYYATRDPLGTKGDFTTAPEISQMFGELIGLWAADVWLKLGNPAAFQLIECGPGRGTLMADVLRAAKKMPGFVEAAQIVLIENSPVLIEKQKQLLKDYKILWADSLGHPQINSSGVPVILLANEFLDALPVQQFEYSEGQWRKRVVVVEHGHLGFVPSSPSPLRGEGRGEGGVNLHGNNPLCPPHPTLSPEGRGLLEGGIFEVSPVRENFVRQTALLVKARRGAALFIDYGYEGPAEGDTLQAIKDHKFVGALEYPGESDLTAHVDFGALKTVAREEGVKTGGPVGQGDFLFHLGVNERANVLLGASKNAEQRNVVASSLARLTAPEQMGRLFKVMALWHDDSLKLEGF
jgi:NADH dehydrogenase [ubiquinone] 1 alpha subcomplex assembly factor 7